MKEYYKVMTLSPNAIPCTFENKKWETREKAEQRMNELKMIHDVPLFVSQVFTN